jgi:nucleoside-diphosphate-sugar epimerase
VHGCVEDSTAYLELIRSANIDVVIDVAGANDGAYKILEDVRKVAADRIKRNMEAGHRNGPKLGFIYCSGSWVHGSDARHKFNDLDLVAVPHAASQPPKLVAWRTALERAILDSRDVLDTMVIRPSLLYGKSTDIWSIFLSPLVEGARKKTASVSLPIDPASRPGLIHLDDVVSGIHAAAEKLPLISGSGVYPVFDLYTGQESMTDIIREAAHVLGYEGKINFEGVGDNLFADAMCTSANGDSNRAKQLLGWTPKRLGGFVCGMPVYAKAFDAAHH